MIKDKFLIVECPRCKRAILIKNYNRKTKICPFCNFRLKILNVKILSIAESLEEAKKQLSLLRMSKIKS
ncbi:MAG: DUF1922 domain-containing protein [Candidatus Bathyarchaeia archaeon]